MKKFLVLLILLNSLLLFSQESILKNSPAESVISVKESQKENDFSLLNQRSTIPSSANPTGNSQEIEVTAGQLSVSLTGGATYDIPIAVPPGINGIVPQISLQYNSQSGNEPAGYGWNITGISTIRRIPATKFHDGTIDGVDFNGLDRFSLDGQRLLIKNGTSGVYGANGTVYETESFSNLKVTSFGIHPEGSNYGPSYFKVEYPDGSFAVYGNGNNSRSKTDWSITYWQNPQGVRISYMYALLNNNLSISSIRYGSVLSTPHINEISFVYKTRQRPEQGYIGGQSFVNNVLLSEINVKSNNVGYRNYVLSHESTSLGYQILKSVTEKSGDNTKNLNPTIFNYNLTANTDLFTISNPISLDVGNINFRNTNYISGDFNGDGNMDFILYPTIGSNAKKKYWLFDELNTVGYNQTVINTPGQEHLIGQFIDIFPTSWLNYEHKLMPNQGWCVIQYDPTSNITSFKNFSKGGTSIYPQHERNYEFPKLSYTIQCPELLHCDLNPVAPVQKTNNNLNKGKGSESTLIEPISENPLYPFPENPLDPNPGNGSANIINCPNPTNINLSPIVNNQAILSWDQNGTPYPILWEVHYFETGLGSDPSDNDPIGTYITLDQNFLEIGNLSNRKNYTFYVRSICSGLPDNKPGKWIGPYKSGGLIINPGETGYKNIPKEFVSGDFNGDGLTDVIAIEKSTGYETRICNTNCYTTNYINIPGGKTYFVNLDTRLTENFVNYSGTITTSNNSKFLVADINGDGKSDLLVFDSGSVKVYTLNDNNTFIQLISVLDSAIKSDKQKFIGDFNGDGKMDFLIPQEDNVDNWCFFLSKGNGFEKITQGIGLKYIIATVGYFGVVGFSDQTFSLNEHSYVVNDFNGDGKSDILYQNNITVEYEMTRRGADYTNNGNPQVTRLVLLENKLSSDTSISFNVITTNSSFGGIRRNPLPIFLNHNNVNKNLEYGLISGNAIRLFKSNKDNRIDTSLKEIILGNGLKEVITYQPLRKSRNPSSPIVYQPSSYTEIYPNFDIDVAANLRVVSKLERVSDNQYIQQKFRYYGAVSNLQGIGFMGFRELHKTDWFNNEDEAITTITKFDITKRGAISEINTVLGTFHPFNYNPTSYIAMVTMEYEDELLPNKVYKIKNTKSYTNNGLESSLKITSTKYDEYNNPLEMVSSFYNSRRRNSLEFKNTKTFEYENNPTGSGIYFIGKPKKTKNTLQTFGGNGGPPLYAPIIQDTRSSEEIYTYSPTLLLTRIQKKGNNTNYVTQDNVYDIFGNIIKKTITADGVSPRVTEYGYDASGRFLLTNKDIEGLITTYSYNTNNGNLNSELLPHDSGYPLITKFEYDTWGKRIKVIDYLGKSSTSNYFKHPENDKITVLSTSSESGNSSFDFYNQLGHKIASTTRDISGNNWSTKQYVYDINGRIIKESEPFLITNPFDYVATNQWNLISYDRYGRLIQKKFYTGKIEDITYSGLTTTSDNGVKKTITTKNVIGNVVSLTDNGGTITYEYYADGNLKESNYGGISMQIEQDGWGRKTKLTDPSAGVFTYQYNELGELIKETTPNGTTSYSLDNYGKIISKSIYGLNTNSQLNYTYDTTKKLLTKITHIDSYENVSTIYTYDYDNYRRLWRTKESGDLVFYQKATSFDAFGRTDKEYYKAINKTDSQTLEKTFKHIYKNGYNWQITDDTSQKVLWQTNTTNARGQLTDGQFGNGVKVTNKYDEYGFPMMIQHQKTEGINPINMKLGTTFDQKRGNLLKRTNNLFSWSEDLQYDELDRLTHYKDASMNIVKQFYDDKGRITENTLGIYEYSTNSYQNTAIDPSSIANAYYRLREGIFFDTMENASGWNMTNSGVTFDTAVSHPDMGGTTSLKIVNESAVQEKTVQSEIWVPINNAQPTQYTYSGWVYSNGPQTELSLLMKDSEATEYITMTDSTVSNTAGEWHYITKTFTVPSNIKYVSFRINNKGMINGRTAIWVDNVKIRKAENSVTDPSNDRYLDISYNTFKAPVDIFEPGIERLSFRYNANGQRATLLYGGLQTDKMLRPLRKHYSADGTMEIKHNIQTDEVEFLFYIGGDAYSAPVVLKSNATEEEYLYLHRDYQNSIVAISDQSGQIIEKRLFDAWGNILQVQDRYGKKLSELMILDRGYTGHEHLKSINIIHMNGRLYDPAIHRFLQPDNFVQDPYNTQSFNRYAYCLNNPFMYTDQNGEFWLVAAGFVVGAYLGASIQQGTLDPGKWDSNWWKGAIVGGIIGAYGGQVLATGPLSGAGLSNSGFSGILQTAIKKGATGMFQSYLSSIASLPDANGIDLDFSLGKDTFDKLWVKGISSFAGSFIDLGLNQIYKADKEGEMITSLFKNEDISKISKNVLGATSKSILSNIINDKPVFKNISLLSLGNGTVKITTGIGNDFSWNKVIENNINLNKLGENGLNWLEYLFFIKSSPEFDLWSGANFKYANLVANKDVLLKLTLREKNRFILSIVGTSVGALAVGYQTGVNNNYKFGNVFTGMFAGGILGNIVTNAGLDFYTRK